MGGQYAHSVIISNADRPVPMTGDDRRYYAIQCPATKKGHVEWFADIVEEMRSGGLEAMAYDLLRWQPADGSWRFLWEVPDTKANDAMAAFSLKPMERFLCDLALNTDPARFTGADGDPVILAEDTESRLQVADLAAAFRQWCEHGGVSPAERHRMTMSNEAVGHALNKAMGVA